MRARLSILVLLVTLGSAGLAGSAPVQRESDPRLDRAAEHIAAGRYDEAVVELDALIAEQERNWEAHYQRGRALGLAGRMDEALPALLRAVRLNPGFAHGHELAAIAAWESGDRDLAWEQIVRAFHGGADVEERIRRWVAEPGAPERLMEWLGAPRIYVDGIDLEEISARSELPFNRNPLAREDRSRAGVPDEIRGRETATEAQADLQRVLLQFRTSIDGSSRWGLVLDPRLSEYVLRLAVDELDQTPPRDMAGYLELVATSTGESGYRRRFELRNIEARGELLPQIEMIVDDLEEWLAQLQRSPDDSR